SGNIEQPHRAGSLAEHSPGPSWHDAWFQHIVQDNFEGPGRGKAHRRLKQHRRDDDRKPAPVRAQQAERELQHEIECRPMGAVASRHRWTTSLLAYPMSAWRASASER